jgi:hypothetical protein
MKNATGLLSVPAPMHAKGSRAGALKGNNAAPIFKPQLLFEL